MAKRKPGEKIKETNPAIIAFQKKEKERKKTAQKKRDAGGSRAKKISDSVAKKEKVKKKVPPVKNAIKVKEKKRGVNFLQRAIDNRKKQIKKATGL